MVPITILVTAALAQNNINIYVNDYDSDECPKLIEYNLLHTAIIGGPTNGACLHLNAISSDAHDLTVTCNNGMAYVKQYEEKTGACTTDLDPLNPTYNYKEVVISGDGECSDFPLRGDENFKKLRVLCQPPETSTSTITTTSKTTVIAPSHLWDEPCIMKDIDEFEDATTCFIYKDIYKTSLDCTKADACADPSDWNTTFVAKENLDTSFCPGHVNLTKSMEFLKKCMSHLSNFWTLSLFDHCDVNNGFDSSITFETLRVERTREFSKVFWKAQFTAKQWRSLETWDIGAGRDFREMFQSSNANLNLNGWFYDSRPSTIPGVSNSAFDGFLYDASNFTNAGAMPKWNLKPWLQQDDSSWGKVDSLWTNSGLSADQRKFLYCYNENAFLNLKKSPSISDDVTILEFLGGGASNTSCAELLSQDDDSALSTPAIAGIAVGGTVALAGGAVALAAYTGKLSLRKSLGAPLL